MLLNLFLLRKSRLTKWSRFEHSSRHNAPYVHPRLDSILELCQTFLIAFAPSVFNASTLILNGSQFDGPDKHFRFLINIIEYRFCYLGSLFSNKCALRWQIRNKRAMLVLDSSPEFYPCGHFC